MSKQQPFIEEEKRGINETAILAAALPSKIIKHTASTAQAFGVHPSSDHIDTPRSEPHPSIGEFVLLGLKHSSITPPADDIPSMHYLEHLKVIQKVAIEWKKVANLLRLPTEVVNNVHQDTVMLGCERSCREIFSRWLAGEGCQPITWRKLIEVMEDAERSILAQELAEFVSSQVQ